MLKHLNIDNLICESFINYVENEVDLDISIDLQIEFEELEYMYPTILEDNLMDYIDFVEDGFKMVL